jgi:hypothetical protein
MTIQVGIRSSYLRLAHPFPLAAPDLTS